MLSNLDACMKRLGRVTGEYRNATLAKNQSRIDTRVDQVNGATCLGNLCLDGLSPGLKSPERWQERGMNVQDAARESPQKRLLDHAHETCKHHEIDPGPLEQSNHFGLGLR